MMVGNSLLDQQIPDLHHHQCLSAKIVLIFLGEFCLSKKIIGYPTGKVNSVGFAAAATNVIFTQCLRKIILKIELVGMTYAVYQLLVFESPRPDHAAKWCNPCSCRNPGGRCVVTAKITLG